MQPLPPTRRVPDWVFVVLLALAGTWAAGLVCAANLTGWFVEEVLLTQELAYPAYVWPAIALGTALLVAMPVVPQAVFVRRPRLRAVAQTWALATLCLPILAAVRAVPLPDGYSAALVGLAAAALATGAFLLFRRRIGRGGVVAGCLSGLVLLLPWAWAGALGAPYEVAADAFAAASVGALGAVLLAGLLWPAFAEVPAPRWQQIVSGVPAAGVATLLLAAGAGPVGPHLPLLLTLPAGAGVLAVLAAAGRRGLPAGVLLLGAAALGPAAFTDPEEITILLGLQDVALYAAIGAGASALLGLLLAGGLWVAASVDGLAPRPDSVRRRVVAGVTAVCLVAAGGAVSVVSGQAGFHGERLFVVLKDQATVGARPSGEDIDARRARVYRELVDHADRSQRSLRAELADRGVDYTPFYLVNGVEVPDSPLLRRWLAGRSEVARVLEAPRLRPLPRAASQERGALSAPGATPWGITRIGADAVHDKLHIDGTGVVVGVSDSGVDGAHPALVRNYRGDHDGPDYNWYDPWNGTTTPTDTGGHGTHTTATVVGGKGVGVAPGAQWIGCVNLARNLGSAVRYLDCLQFMLAPFPVGGDPLRDGRPGLAADVLNNSWGCPEIEGCTADALLPAVRALRAAGIFVVASAGNTGPRCDSVTDPIALYQDAFTVGASNVKGEVADFSSRGPVRVDGSGRVKPDLLAPGVDVLSALPDGTYGRNDGTSMAGPHVAGVVALMWEANPALVGDIDRTAELLRSTARPAVVVGGTCGGDPANVVGAGTVDAYAAVTAAGQAAARR